jgi:hypothetical protein
MYLMLSEESIITGLYVLALIPIRVLILPLSGIKSSSLLEPGGSGKNFVVFATRSGETTPAMVLLSITNVTVWGSAAPSVGLSHITRSPALISTFWGTNIVHGPVAFPPQAATFTTAGGNSCGVVLLILCCNVPTLVTTTIIIILVNTILSILGVIILVIYNKSIQENCTSIFDKTPKTTPNLIFHLVMRKDILTARLAHTIYTRWRYARTNIPLNL